MQSIVSAFEFFDADRSGAIDSKEMHKAMKSLGFRLTIKEAEQIIKDLDSDGSGRIEFDEWVLVMTSKMGERMTKFGSGSELGYRGALRKDMEYLLHARDKRLEATRANLRAKKQQVDSMVSRRVAELDQTTADMRQEQLDREKKIIRRQVKPSKLMLELQKGEEAAVMLGKWSDCAEWRRLIKDEEAKENKKTAMETKMLIKRLRARQGKQERELCIRSKEKNKAILYKSRIQAENEMRLMNARLKNSVDSCARRHNHSLMIHNNQLPDTGMHKMRTIGERLQHVIWPLGKAQIESLGKAHVFTEQEEIQARIGLRRERRDAMRKTMTLPSIKCSTPIDKTMMRTMDIRTPPIRSYSSTL